MGKLTMRKRFLLLVLSGFNIFGSREQSKIDARQFVKSVSDYSMKVGAVAGGFEWHDFYIGNFESNRKQYIHHVNLSQQIKTTISSYSVTRDTHDELERFVKEKQDFEKNVFDKGVMSRKEHLKKKNQLEALHCSRLLLFSCEVMKMSMSESEMNSHLQSSKLVYYRMKNVEESIRLNALDIKKQLI